jgi:hypothetical protein
MIAAHTASPLTMASSPILTASPTGPEKNAIAREGALRNAADADSSRDGAGVGTAVELTLLLSGREVNETGA